MHEAVFSRTALGYRLSRAADGSPVFGNPGGRAERLSHLRRYCADVLGHDLRSESTHYAIGELASYTTLLREYPGAFAGMVMCTRTLGDNVCAAPAPRAWSSRCWGWPAATWRPTSTTTSC